MRRVISANGLQTLGIVKSVQRGQTNFNTTNMGYATVAAVNVDNAVLRWTGITNGSTCDSYIADAYYQIISPTQLRFTRYDTSSSAGTVAIWELIEFHKGIIRRIQRGLTTVSSSPIVTTIAPVDLRRVSLHQLGYLYSGQFSYYLRPTISLKSATEVQAECGAANQVASWQVVEFNNTPIELQGFRRQGIVKNVQRGLLGLNIDTQVVTIQPIRYQNTVLRWNSEYSGQNANNYDAWIRWETESSFRAWRGVGTTGYVTLISWEVVEYWPGVLRSWQQAIAVFNMAPVNVTVNFVDVNRTGLENGGMYYNDGNAGCGYIRGCVQLNNATTVYVFTSAYNNQQTAFQVTEYY